MVERRIVEKAKERQRNDASAASVTLSDTRSIARANASTRNRLTKRHRRLSLPASEGAGQRVGSPLASAVGSVKSAPASLKRRRSVQAYVEELFPPTPLHPEEFLKKRRAWAHLLFFPA